MSIYVNYPAPKKLFFWNVNDASSIERGIGGYYNADTDEASTTSSSRVNLKTYTFTAGPYVNYVRIRVYVRLSAVPASAIYVYINLNGTDVNTTQITTAYRLIDYFGAITPNTTYTVNIDGLSNPTITLTITKVYIIAGFGLKSTTPTQILTINLDTSGIDSYVLKSNGNFIYKMGVRYWIYGNRMTSATSNLFSTLTNEIQSSKYLSLWGSIDDGDNNVLITIITGDYPGDNASFTISGSVAADGDIVIITGIYAQVILRANLVDKYNIYSNWSFIIRERGLIGWTSHRITIAGPSYTYINAVNLNTYYITKNGQQAIFNVVQPTGSSEVINGFISTSDDTAETTVLIYYNEDSFAEAFADYINIIVI